MTHLRCEGESSQLFLKAFLIVFDRAEGGVGKIVEIDIENELVLPGLVAENNIASAFDPFYSILADQFLQRLLCFPFENGLQRWVITVPF